MHMCTVVCYAVYYTVSQCNSPKTLAVCSWKRFTILTAPYVTYEETTIYAPLMEKKNKLYILQKHFLIQSSHKYIYNSKTNILQALNHAFFFLKKGLEKRYFDFHCLYFLRLRFINSL